MPPIDAEDTLDDDEMRAPVVDEATGEVRVLAERCGTCIFRPGNPFRATIPGPVRDMITDAVQAEGHVTCHSTLPGQAPAGVEPAICRGYADIHGDRSLALRVAAALGRLRELPPPT